MRVLVVLGNNKSHLTFSGIATDLGVGSAPGRCAKSVAGGRCPGMKY